MEFVTLVLSPLIVPVKRHLGFFFSSSNYVRDMHEKVRELNDTACVMDSKWNENNAKSIVVPGNVPEWMKQVEKIKEMGDSIPTNGVGCLNIRMRYKAGKQSSKILKVIDRLMSEKSKMVWTDTVILSSSSTSTSVHDNNRLMGGKSEIVWTDTVSPPRPSTSILVHDDVRNINENRNNFKSRDMIFDYALKSLEPNNNKTQKIAICGMAGVGKTTMMEQLKRAAQDREMFDCIVTVCVGQNPNLLSIQQDVALHIHEDLTETNKDTRAAHLQNRFEEVSKEGKKKVLVILDDVWEEFNLKEIGLTSPLPNGFKLLLTSRDEKVCTQMGFETSSILKMNVLNDLQAKKLFWETTRLDPDSDIEPYMYQTGDEIVKMCGGLPLAIIVTARILRDNKEKIVWKETLSRLQNKNNKYYDNEIITIFEISYNNLTEDEKATFLLIGFFPGDYNIDIEDLLRYGWGLKFFKNIDTITKARSQVKTCVDSLIRSNLLLNGDHAGCVKMHDIVRNFALSNFSKVKQASILNHDIGVSEQLSEYESYERILLKCKGMFEFPIDFNHPNLALLKLMDGEELLKYPEDFFTRMEKLEVLAYENMHRPLLPRQLNNLVALFIHSCSLMDDDISFLGDLSNLEVLSLAYCRIQKLPLKIGKLKRLKLLDLTGCGDLCIDDGIFENFGELEELYMGVSERSAIGFTNADNELKMLSSKLSALEVEFFKNEAQPKNLSFENLERFRISIGCLLEKKSRYHSEVYLYRNTLKLVTSSAELLECKINELFRKTEILYLEVNDMNHLEDLSTHPPEHSFRCLKALHISHCASLTCLFTIHVAKGLKTLESLVIKSCPVLKEIWSCEITSSEEEVDNNTMLRKIEVKDCNSLVNLFPSNPMRLLSHLEDLYIDSCDSLEVLFNIDLGKIEQHSSCSLRTVKVLSSKKLREVWRIKDAENKYFDSLKPICGFQAVEYIQISMCESFKNIVTPATANFDMRALKDIKITKCKEYGERKNESVKNRQEQEISEAGDNMCAFPSCQITNNFHHLRTITLDECLGVEVVFEIESPSNRDQLVTTQQPLPLLPRLEHLLLNNMDMLDHVWKCSNWNEYFIFHKRQQQSSPFQNLTTISLTRCKSIKYLFSPLKVKLLSKVKEVKIRECDGMEEVVSNRDDEETMTSIHAHTTTLFPHLDVLALYQLDNLKYIDGNGVAKVTTKFSQMDVLSWFLCQYSREINISYCDALRTVIPSYAAARMQNLQVLSIEYCRLMVEVFETKRINTDNDNIVAIPRPRNMNMHEFPNLKILTVVECHRLGNIFTFSTLESLENLETLKISHCKEMEVVVREEYEEQTTASSKGVVFPHLKSIELIDLPKLAGFFLGMDINFHWPVLDYVMINYCPQMMAFTSGRSTAPRLKYLYTELGKHNLESHLDSHKSHQTTPPSFDGISSHSTILEGRPWYFS